jgi:NADPH2:quinone reductase
MRAVQITEFGGPEVLRLAEVPDPRPAGGFALIEVEAAGVNYADTHQTENSYLSATTLPLVPGSEVVGHTGDGTRVAAFVGTGGYAERALAPHAGIFPVPPDIPAGQVLALMVAGVTAWHLLRTSARLAAGETVVVHAAAGGVGTLAVQLAKTFGAGRVVAVASTAAKRELAVSLGADATVDAASPELEAQLRAANGGAPVDVVLEMVGGATFDASLAALAPFGRLVTFGTASRELASPVAPAALVRGSRAVIGFWLAHAFTRPGMVGEALGEMLAMVGDGRLRPVVGGSYPLAQARRAHEDLRARRSTGKLVLDPTV